MILVLQLLKGFKDRLKDDGKTSMTRWSEPCHVRGLIVHAWNLHRGHSSSVIPSETGRGTKTHQHLFLTEQSSQTQAFDCSA